MKSSSPSTRKTALIAASLSADELRDRDEVALAVLEPGGLDGAVVHDPVAEAAARRSLIRLELDAAVAQRRGRRLHVVDGEAELVVRARRRAARREDEERSATALVEEVAVIVAYGLELEHVAVEGARTLDVPCR